MSAEFTFRTDLRAVTDAQKTARKNALEEVSLVWLARATLITPVDTGYLRGSLRAEHDDTSAVVGTNAEYALAVHESVDATGDPTRQFRSGQPKFIETPMREHGDAWMDMIARAIAMAGS